MGLINRKTILLGGLAVAAIAGALKNRDKVAGLIGARSSTPEPYGGPSAAPTPSNYDVGGPPENVATHVAAPEPVVKPGAIDERAEEEAAAAEAAAIGGASTAYAGREADSVADEAERPLAEAGEGEAEGREQAEALLRDNAEPAAGDRLDAEAQIEDVIEEADEPTSGERVEAVAPGGSSSEPTGSALGEVSREPSDGGGDTGRSTGSALGEIATPREEAGVEGAAGEEPGPERPSGEADTPERPAAEELTPERPAGEEPAPERPAAEKSSAVWRRGEERSGETERSALWEPPSATRTEDQPTVELDAQQDKPSDEPLVSPPKREDESDSEWQTWSGRAIDRDS